MFHYFLPGATKQQVAPGDKLDHAFLKTLGLDEVLADLMSVPADATVIDRRGPLTEGPGSGSGTLIAPTRKHESGPVVLCDGNLQTWRPVAVGKYLLGYLTAERPNPRSLERKELVGGTNIQDSAGNVWSVPIARAPQWGRPFGSLPQSFTFDERGQPVPHILSRFQWLWELSGEVRDWYRQATPAKEDDAAEEKLEVKEPPSFNRLVQYAARILAVNYRVGQEEINALHAAGLAVLSNETVHAVCQALYGWQIEDEAKKKPTAEDSHPAANSSSSKTGESNPSGAPGTDPAAGL